MRWRFFPAQILQEKGRRAPDAVIDGNTPRHPDIIYRSSHRSLPLEIIISVGQRQFLHRAVRRKPLRHRSNRQPRSRVRDILPDRHPLRIDAHALGHVFPAVITENFGDIISRIVINGISVGIPRTGDSARQHYLPRKIGESERPSPVMIIS